MKISILVLVLWLSYTLAMGQDKAVAGDVEEKKEKNFAEKDVPAVVVAAFKAKFPNCKAEKWQKEDDGYEVEFDKGKDECEALFKTDGTWVETETELTEKQVPAKAIAYIKTNFKGYKMKEFEYEETTASKLYEIEIKKDKEEWDLYFDSQGNFVKKEK